jgi:hypothetical protein
MTNSVNYNYVPNQSVYVINTLGPNGQYPYWGYPYPNGCQYPIGGPIGYLTNYPNGFTSTTPAIQHGVVLQSRILFTTANPPVPTIMYDIRLDGEMGSTVFPENMVYPATAGAAGYQIVDFAGSLTTNTPIAVPPASYVDTFYINGAPVVVSIDLSTVLSVAAFIAAMNNILANKAVLSLVGGNITVTSVLVGAASSIVINEATPPIFASLPGFGSILTAVAGVASGLDQASAAYDQLVK